MQDRSDTTHTVDGVKITPGLWVWDYDLRSVQVDPKQFNDTCPMNPDEGHPEFSTHSVSECAYHQCPGGRHSRFGGQYWDGWYETTINTEGQRAGSMNGTRMITVYEGIKAVDHKGMTISQVREIEEARKLAAADMHVGLIVKIHLPVTDGQDPEFVLAMVRDYFNPRFRRPLPSSAVIDVRLATQED